MRGKVVLVPFPFDDLSATKVRPAVCLTDALGMHQHVILAFVTSASSLRPEATDVVIDPTHAEFTGSGLRVASTLRLHRVITVSASIIQRQLGILGPNLQATVREKLRALFGI